VRGGGKKGKGEEKGKSHPMVIFRSRRLSDPRHLGHVASVERGGSTCRPTRLEVRAWARPATAPSFLPSAGRLGADGSTALLSNVILSLNYSARVVRPSRAARSAAVFSSAQLSALISRPAGRPQPAPRCYCRPSPCRICVSRLGFCRRLTSQLC